MKAAIITEGYLGTGYGHLTRCLSLYQAFEEKGIIPVFIANCDDEGKIFLSKINIVQINWFKEKEKLFNSINGYDIAIIDSYLAPLEIYKEISKIVKKAVYIDDYIRLNYPPGIIVNGTIGAEKLHYNKDKNHEYLLGIDYIPIRKEFWDVEIPGKKNNEIKNVLITFGGKDAKNLTFPILDFLLGKYPDLNYNVVLDINQTNHDSVKIHGPNVHFCSSLNAKEMLNLMLNCDLAVTAAGQTTYELARVGVPTIAVGVADNQKNNINGWLKEGFLIKENWYFQNDLFESIRDQIHEIRSTIFINLKNYCDGQGARRTIKKIV